MQAPSLADRAASIAEHTEPVNGTVDEPLNTGFQTAGRRSAQRSGSRAGRANSAAAAAAQAALIQEAKAAELLKRAAQSVSGDARLQLWQEWARQVSCCFACHAVRLVAGDLLICGQTCVLPTTLRTRLLMFGHKFAQLAETKAGRGVSYASAGGRAISFDQVLPCKAGPFQEEAL